MIKDFHSVWNSKDGIGFMRKISSINDVVFIIADGGIFSEKMSVELINNPRKIEKYQALEFKEIDYFIYCHKSNCQNLRIAGNDLCCFINYVQTNYHYQTIILVSFSKATIAAYYALTSTELMHSCQLKFIAGGAPWLGTELCDSNELKNIPSRLPWPIVEFFIKIFLKTNLEKDLSPNSESVKNINFKQLNSIIDIQYDTDKKNYHSYKPIDIIPDTFVWWVFKGYFADGVIPMNSQKATNVMHKLVSSTHCSALQKIISDICITLKI